MRLIRNIGIALLGTALVSCANDPAAVTPDGGAIGDAGALGSDGAITSADGCSILFAQDTLPEYEVDIAPAEWAALTSEFLNRSANEAAGDDINPLHPASFHFNNGAPVPGVLIRLHGNSSWRAAVANDPHPKMQFTIAFNEVNKDGRFLGVRKVDLDMPRTDASFLRQRLALHYLRGMGVSAQCGNNARLVINGAYYGLYTNLEHMDKEYLQRNFVGASDGDLWKGGRELQTNKDNFSWARLDAFWKVTTVEALAGMADLPAAVHEWAAEAMMPDGDGYYGGGHNYFLYDHPTRGFVWLAQDLDSTFDFRASDISPTLWSRKVEPPLHYRLVMNDPTWNDHYVSELGNARAGFHVDDLQARVDEWARQIADSSAQDKMKPFDDATHVAAVTHLRASVAQRAAYIDSWLACRSGSGPLTDADGDGSDFCHDCDDGDPAAHPGAPETCNLQDDDCDGRIDNAPECPTTP